MNASSGGAPAAQGLFAERNFRLYTVASVFSWLSFFVQTLAVSWLAWDLTHSASWLGVITFLDAAPYFLFGPWGSVLADRFDRHRILMIGYGFALLQSVLLAGGSMAGLLDIHLLGALAFVHGTVHAFSVPAAYGLLPRAVSRRNLAAAIAFASSYRTLAMFAGPALAGLMLAWFPVSWSFLFNALGYGVYLGVLWAMRLPPAPPPEPSGRSFYGDYVDGLRYAARHPVIAMLLVVGACNDGLRALTMRLLPAFADRLYPGTGAGGLAWLAGATGVGAALASLWLARQRRAGLVASLVPWGFALALLSTLVFVWAAQPLWAVAARALFGAAAEGTLTAIMILVQTHVDDAYRSRVLGLMFLMSQVGNAAMLVVGPLAERFGLDAPVLVFCAGCAGVLAWSLRRGR